METKILLRDGKMPILLMVMEGQVLASLKLAIFVLLLGPSEVLSVVREWWRESKLVMMEIQLMEMGVHQPAPSKLGKIAHKDLTVSLNVEMGLSLLLKNVMMETRITEISVRVLAILKKDGVVLVCPLYSQTHVSMVS